MKNEADSPLNLLEDRKQKMMKKKMKQSPVEPIPEKPNCIKNILKYILVSPSKKTIDKN